MRKIWVKASALVKLTAEQKDAILERVRTLVISSKILAPVINRLDLENGRIFLYFLYQVVPTSLPGLSNSAPLIEGKYVERCYARITLFNVEASECAADLERQAGQWVPIKEGSLEVCLKTLEEKKEFQAQFAGLDVRRSPKSPLLLN